MFVLNVINRTDDVISYFSGAAILLPNSTTPIDQDLFFDFATDGQVREDILLNRIQVSDGVNNYGNNDALRYLERIQGTTDKDGRGITSTILTSKQGLDVNVLNSIPISDSGIATNIYDEVTGIANGIPTTILNYTLLANQKFVSVSVSGTNVAMYEVLIDSVIASKKYTYFGGSFSADFNMGSLSLTTGQNIQIMVTHARPHVGDFNSNIILKET